MIRKKAKILLASIMFLALDSAAQFRYTALLDTVKTTGFYSFAITPELSSYLKTDLSDLRIIDDKKQQVAFISDIPYNRKAIHAILFEQKIIQNITIDSKTTLVIENTGKSELSNFVIDLKNAAAERTASLSGSDDKITWFAILDSLLLHASGDYDNSSHSQRVNFPKGNYKYFKLTVNNDRKAPLSILKVRSSDISAIIDTTQFYFNNPPPSFSQTDSSGYSIIKVVNRLPFHITSITVGISGPWLYKRQAKLFTELKAGLPETWNSHNHAAFTITSDEFGAHSIPLLKSRIFYLVIENGDNPPLTIENIASTQLKRQVIAQLEKGKSYSLLLDNPKGSSAEYDLQHFRDKIPAVSPINVKNVIALSPEESIPAEKQVKNGWIWPVIILVIALLAILAWKLTTDMKNK